MLDKKQPIVVKKIIAGGHEHHGGAWKVAFADFAVAMMAFFMLMWLMGGTTNEDKAAISEYFNNPSMSEGTATMAASSGMQGPGGASTSMIQLGGAMDLTPGDTEKYSSGQQHDNKKAEEQSDETAKEAAAEKEKQRLEELMENLKKAIDKSQALAPFKDQLLLDITPEGLRIQIVDKENRPMFASGSARLQRYTKEILADLGKFLNDVPNRISLAGHTDASAFTRADGYGNWELSADRANAARRALIAGKMAGNKVKRVTGLGSSVLFDKRNPRAPINRRISIIVLSGSVEEDIDQHEARAGFGIKARSNIDMDAPNADKDYELMAPEAELTEVGEPVGEGKEERSPLFDVEFF